ncbi:MAG: hypothetical protein ABIP74_03505 [Candidatus Saccharimonas sp.]
MSNIPEIFHHEDLPALDLVGDQDPLTVQYMREAQKLSQELVLCVSLDEKRALVDAFNTEWKCYKGQQAIIAGAYRSIYEGERVDINYQMRSYGYFQGISVPVDEHGVPEDMPAYHFSSNPKIVDSEVHFHADLDAHLEFPFVISQEQLNILAAPLLEAVDGVIFDESNRSFVDLLEALDEMVLVDNIDEPKREIVYGIVAAYLNDAIDMDDVIGLSATLDGAAYCTDDHEAISVQGNYTLVDPYFTYHVVAEGIAELCIAGGLTTRRQGFSERICSVPLDIMTRMKAIERAPADER